MNTLKNWSEKLTADERDALTFVRGMRTLGSADKRLMMALPTPKKALILSAAMKMADLLDGVKPETVKAVTDTAINGKA